MSPCVGAATPFGRTACHTGRVDVRIKRVYEPAESADGVRVLVDRLWPRGVSKGAAELALWAKDAAPSAELRRTWHADPNAHEPDHFHAFADAYRAELGAEPAATALRELVSLAERSTRVTLVFGARDERVNHAVVLRDAILGATAD